MYSPNLNNRLYVQVVASMDNYHHRVSYSFTVVLILILGVRFRSHRMTVHIYWSDGVCRKSKDRSRHHVGKARWREKARTTWLCNLLQVRKAPEARTGQPALSQHEKIIWPRMVTRQPHCRRFGLSQHWPAKQKLNYRQVSPFPSVAKHGQLTYELKLPWTCQIHLVFPMVKLSKAKVDEWEWPRPKVLLKVRDLATGEFINWIQHHALWGEEHRRGGIVSWMSTSVLGMNYWSRPPCAYSTCAHPLFITLNVCTPYASLTTSASLLLNSIYRVGHSALYLMLGLQ